MTMNFSSSTFGLHETNVSISTNRSCVHIGAVFFADFAARFSEEFCTYERNTGSFMYQISGLVASNV